MTSLKSTVEYTTEDGKFQIVKQTNAYIPGSLSESTGDLYEVGVLGQFSGLLVVLAWAGSLNRAKEILEELRTEAF